MFDVFYFFATLAVFAILLITLGANESENSSNM